MITIDCTSYPVWSKFIDNKDEWIGGILREDNHSTVIRDISLTKESNAIVFRVTGGTFSCAFNIAYGGAVPSNNFDSISFSAYTLSFSISKKKFPVRQIDTHKKGS